VVDFTTQGANGYFHGSATPVYDAFIIQYFGKYYKRIYKIFKSMRPPESSAVLWEVSAAVIGRATVTTIVADGTVKAQEVQDEAAKEALTRMSDTASPEFQERTQNTMYCMPLNTFESFTLDADTATNYQGSYIVNADFEKMPTYGLQLQLKCKIADGTYVFYTVTPAQWETLPETGNIVLHVDYVLYGTYGINVWITGITEMNVSDITVNPEDSAARLQDIVNLPTAEEVVE
jgi:hypothetical protein